MKYKVVAPRVALITILDNSNFGTYLQAVATCYTIKKLGASITVIRYERPSVTPKRKGEQQFHFLTNIRGLIRRLQGNNHYIQRMSCLSFLKKHVNVTRLYYSYADLCAHPPKADIYITGSDQVWNTIHNRGIEKAYYLGFVSSNKAKKISYAASIGMDEIPSEFRQTTKELLQQYNAISVREKSNVTLLKEIGIKAENVLDPTFLLKRKEWQTFARPYNHTKPYVLVYSVEEPEQNIIVSQVAKYIKEKLNADIIEVSYRGEDRKIDGCDFHCYYATPDTFLSLFLGASFAIVSSFHGTAFSLNLNIPFITIAPDRFSSRIDSILKLTKTENRKIQSFDCHKIEAIYRSQIDFELVNRLLDEQRDLSLEFLKNNIH